MPGFEDLTKDIVENVLAKYLNHQSAGRIVQTSRCSAQLFEKPNLFFKLLHDVKYSKYEAVKKIIAKFPEFIFAGALQLSFTLLDTPMWQLFYHHIKHDAQWKKLFMQLAHQQKDHVSLNIFFEMHSKTQDINKCAIEISRLYETSMNDFLNLISPLHLEKKIKLSDKTMALHAGQHDPGCFLQCKASDNIFLFTNTINAQPVLLLSCQLNNGDRIIGATRLTLCPTDFQQVICLNTNISYRNIQGLASQFSPGKLTEFLDNITHSPDYNAELIQVYLVSSTAQDDFHHNLTRLFLEYLRTTKMNIKISGTLLNIYQASKSYPNLIGDPLAENYFDHCLNVIAGISSNGTIRLSKRFDFSFTDKDKLLLNSKDFTAYIQQQIEQEDKQNRPGFENLSAEQVIKNMKNYHCFSSGQICKKDSYNNLQMRRNSH